MEKGERTGEKERERVRGSGAEGRQSEREKGQLQSRRGRTATPPPCWISFSFLPGVDQGACAPSFVPRVQPRPCSRPTQWMSTVCR